MVGAYNNLESQSPVIWTASAIFGECINDCSVHSFHEAVKLEAIMKD